MAGHFDIPKGRYPLRIAEYTYIVIGLLPGLVRLTAAIRS